MSEHFKGGQKPTLFPFYKKVLEDQATSILFAVLAAVLPFRDRMLKSVGEKSYKTGNDFECVLRPLIGGRVTSKDIPDALITLTQKEIWRALVEVKIGSADLDQAQLVRYLNRAISEKVDCLITISNEMCVTPNEPPLRLKPAEKRLRKIKHFHWSWRYIEYVAKQTLNAAQLNDMEADLLQQFVELIDSDTGIHGFRAMPKCWPSFVDTLRDGGSANDEDKDQVISAWFQETADISIILSEIFAGEVEVIKSEASVELRREAADHLLNKESDLFATFKLPSGKEINITVDVNSRVIKFETNHLPTDKVKTSHKKIERFLGLFIDPKMSDEWGDHSDVRLFAKWKRQRNWTDNSMVDAMIDLKEDVLEQSKLILPGKELSLIKIQYTPSGAASQFRSSKKFIEFLENQVKFFAETYVEV